MGKTSGIHGYGHKSDAHVFGSGLGRRQKRGGCRTDLAPCTDILWNCKVGNGCIALQWMAYAVRT